MLAELSMCVLLGAVQDRIAVAPLPDPFVPSLHFATRPVDFWLEQLAQAPATATRAVWCLYYSDERSERVVAALEHAFGASVDTTRAVDTVLNDWGIAFEPLTIASFAGDYRLAGVPRAIAVLPNELFGRNWTMLEGSDEDLLLLARSDDDFASRNAAFTLVSQRRRLDETLDLLLERNLAVSSLAEHARTGQETGVCSPSFVNWYRADLGSAVGERVVARLMAATDDAQRLKWLRYLVQVGAEVGPPLEFLERFYEDPGELGAAVRDALTRLCQLGVGLDSMRDDRAFHERWNRQPLDDSERARAPLTTLVPHFGRAVQRGVVDEELLLRVQMAGLRSSLARDALTPTLLELLKRDDALGVAALRILGHLGSDDERVLKKYTTVVNAWSDCSAAGLATLPCLERLHGPALDALRSLFARAPNKGVFEDRLAFAGLLDGIDEPMVRRMLEDEAARYPQALAFTVQAGFRAVLPSTPDEPKIAQVHKLPLTIAAKRAHGLDWSSEARQLAAIFAAGYPESGAGGYADYFEWGLVNAIALKLSSPELTDAALKIIDTGGFPKGFDLHVDYARNLLEFATLTPEQAARLATATPVDDGGDGWHGLSLVGSAAPSPRSRIEGVPLQRARLYAGEWQMLGSLLGATRLIARDEPYLVAALQHGPATARASALELVDAHQLDTPAIRSAVVMLATDCDRETREAATRIRAARGW